MDFVYYVGMVFAAYISAKLAGRKMAGWREADILVAGFKCAAYFFIFGGVWIALLYSLKGLAE
jgi:hypothetical protein